MPLRPRLSPATAALLLSALALAPACKRDEGPGAEQKVELSTLQKDRNDDARAADAKWKNKPVEVTGRVNKAWQDVDTREWTVWVGSGSDDMPESLLCGFPSWDKRAPTLKPKQRVIVHARVGAISRTQIWMDECHLDEALDGDGGT
jgi:hypothetical protein